MKKHKKITKLFYLFLIWRICLFGIAWFGSLFLRFQPSFPYSDAILLPSGLPSWLWSFANFDGVHYLTIAKSGYSAQFTQVFFPLYPLIIRLFLILVPIFNPIPIALFVSNVAFLLSLFLFRRLLLLDYPEKKVFWILLFLLFFPTSLFFGAVYTEGIFFLLMIASFYTARLKKWYLSACLASLAGMTRLVGIFLLPAILWEWYQEKIKDQNLSAQTSSKNIITRLFSDIFLILKSPVFYIIPLGCLFYMTYLQLAFGDFLYFWHAQPVFGAQRSGATLILLPQVIWRYMKLILSISYKNYAFWVALWEISFTFFSIIILLISHMKKIRISYLIFSWLAVITPTLTGTFSSMPRYVLAAFPLFIILGLIRSSWLKIFILTLSITIFILFTVLFTRGLWVS